MQRLRAPVLISGTSSCHEQARLCAATLGECDSFVREKMPAGCRFNRRFVLRSSS